MVADSLKAALWNWLRTTNRDFALPVDISEDRISPGAALAPPPVVENRNYAKLA
jgi:hypothetical protein